MPLASPSSAIRRSPSRSQARPRARVGAARRPTRPVADRVPIVRSETPLDAEGLKSRLLASIRQAHPQADLAVAERAFDLAIEAHSTQVRASGEPYVTHPIASAQILADLGIDPVAVAAALLHDVPEDTEYSLADVEEQFGPEIAHLVDGVTKLSKFSTHSHEQQQAENIRKMFLAMADDIRVVLIKLADRLHNMRTLGYLKAEKQQRIARQTQEIYAPLAERLGIWQIKWELEDLSFKVLEPEAFRELARLLDTRRRGRESYIERAIEELRPRLEQAGIDAELQGRPKHIYSIWKKMQRKSAEFGEIYDVYAIRLLVDEIRDCYAALGIVHALWRPIPGQFDDYIAVPKNNLYQSLHTAVIALDGKPLEIQIRTHAMHQVSEVGIAAHWRYKEGSKAERDYDAKLAWLRQLMEWQRDVSESDATEFVEGIKLDIFQDQVFVFTPRGDVKDLPAGATPLDFAYRIHTDIGHRTIGAKVNNRLVPLDYRLKNGDIVEIVTTKGEHGPSRDWLNIVRTSHAREKIRQWFKKKDRAENIVHGRESLERELRRLARTSIQSVGLDRIAEVARLYNHDTVDDFFAAIGYGAIGTQQVVMRLGVLDDGHLRAAHGRAPAAGEDRRGPGQGGGGPAGPVRQVLPPDPGRPDPGVHHPRQGDHRPPSLLPDGAQRARGHPADRRRVGGRAGPDVPDRDPRRGLRPDGPPVRHHAGHGGEQGQHPVGERRREPRPHGGGGDDPPGRVGGAAGEGDESGRATQGRAERAARSGVAAASPAHGGKMAPDPGPAIDVRPLTPADRVQWARLLATCFDREPEQMEALLAWFHAGFPLVTMGAWDGDRLVAQYNCRLLDLRIPGMADPVPAGMGLNMAVDPGYRGRGLLDLVATPVHEEIARRGCVAGVGFSSAGGLAATRASRRYAYEVLGPMVSVAIPVARARYPAALAMTEAWPDGAMDLPAHDDGLVRYAVTPASLRHRFAEHPFRRYAYAVRRREGAIDGLIVYRPTSLRGIPGVSLLAAYGDDLRGLLGGFAASLRPRRRMLVHLVASPGSPLHAAAASIGPAFRVRLTRHPYHLIARALATDVPPCLFELDRWDCAGGDIL